MILAKSKDAVNAWAGRHPAASWFIHGTVCFAAASAGAWLGHALMGWWFPHAGLVGLCFVALGMMGYFLRKEILDWRKWGAKGALEEAPGGVTKRNDGWGDLVGPVYFLVGVLSAWYWA